MFALGPAALDASVRTPQKRCQQRLIAHLRHQQPVSRCTATHAAFVSGLPPADVADPAKVLLLWDLDNLSPPGGANGVALWAHGFQVY